VETRLRVFPLKKLIAMTNNSKSVIRILTVLLLASALSACGLFGGSKDKAPPLGSEAEEQQTEAAERAADASEQSVIEPTVARRKIKIPGIDNEDFEIGAHYGVINIEDFGSSSTYGARLAYHLNEDFFLEATYAQAKAGKTSLEHFFNTINLLTEKEREYKHYGLSASWNALPGEVFIGKNRVYNSAFYLSAGMGWAEFAGDSHFTASAGLGYRVLLNDWIAVRFDFKDTLFDMDLVGPKKVTHNLEGVLGLTVFF
jgi:outer membrane beta-barrel protein